MEKCLAFCQGLVQSNNKFSFNFSCGKDNFNFDNKELVNSSWKKKKSPSQLRRQKKRREAAIDAGVQVRSNSTESCTLHMTSPSPTPFIPSAYSLSCAQSPSPSAPSANSPCASFSGTPPPSAPCMHLPVLLLPLSLSGIPWRMGWFGRGRICSTSGWEGAISKNGRYLTPACRITPSARKR